MALRGNGYGEFFDAVVHFKHGDKEQALSLLTLADSGPPNSYNQLLHEWRRALRAEATGAPATIGEVQARIRELCRRLINAR